MGGWIRRAPRFSVQRSPNTYFKGFGGLWTENRGAKKTRKSTTTDPTPHSRPSNCNLAGDTKAEFRKFLEARPRNVDFSDACLWSSDFLRAPVFQEFQYGTLEAQ